jgi:hypothetical protein
LQFWWMYICHRLLYGNLTLHSCHLLMGAFGRMSSGFFFRLKEDETMADDVSNTALSWLSYNFVMIVMLITNNS